MSEDLLVKIFNSFDPFFPLDINNNKDASLYVDMSDSRGGAKIERDLGKTIIRCRDNRATTQLYTGHRGTGKSTELLRLKKYLEEQGCYVVYFAADDGDIDPEDAQYSDVLIACTRQLLDKLKPYADQSLLQKWVGSRLQELKELAFAEVTFEQGKVDIPLMFAKMSMAIRKIPSERRKIRDIIEPNTITLLESLQGFIKDAKGKLPDGKKQLVVIVDNLDRIVPIRRQGGRTNHEEIFVDRAEQLKDLGCDVVYTVPISIAYSRANELGNNYDSDPVILPITAVKTKDGEQIEAGINELKEVIRRRVRQHLTGEERCELVPQIFGSDEILQRLCLMSGGHVRDLLRLVRTSFDEIETLPITKVAARSAMIKMRDTYRRSVTSPEEWLALARVAKTKQVEGSEQERQLLFSRCILQYRLADEAPTDVEWDDDDWEEDAPTWYDVHPLILNIQQFKAAQRQLEEMEREDGNG
ncbi:ATP-binding protein [[Limnothrix rosea] IAM M-220]|uniref:ATP-binding protein n=1 Tax=[Limnothrix rosea] IAM M-220 TaxID=454133 RepID=UPI00096160CE|nr:ATP-binding protein [[Limnothrix rosea] IAM M-220]OKH15184.1 hypothetical protein NIES208_12985 [[Limnothrix rosea] IAM M-220]